MGRAGELLEAGEILGMFPRGTSKPAAGQNWHRGAARLALAHGAPLVPVRLVNTRQLMPRRLVEVRVGEPLVVERSRLTIAAARELTARARSAVDEL